MLKIKESLKDTKSHNNEKMNLFNSRGGDYMSVSLLDMSPIGDIYFIWCFDPYDMGPL